MDETPCNPDPPRVDVRVTEVFVRVTPDSPPVTILITPGGQVTITPQG